MKVLDTIDQWIILRDKLMSNEWYLWQMQYGIDQPEGFHAWFAKSGKKDYEVVTHNKEICTDIVKFNSSKRNK